MSSSTTPNLQATVEFLHLLDPNGMFSFATFDDRKEAQGRVLAQRRHGSLDQLQDELIALNAAGAGVFVTINELDGAGFCNKNVGRVRAVFVDLDGADLGPVENWSLLPQIIVETSPGRWHAYWLIERMDRDDFKDMQKALATLFDGDTSVCDLARVMRLPGFHHCKGAPTEVKLIAARPELPRYTHAQLRAALGMGEPETVALLPATRDLSAEVIPEGKRNVTLASIGGRLLRSGHEKTSIESRLQTINSERCVPPLPRTEVTAIAGSIARYASPMPAKIDLITTDTGNAKLFVQLHDDGVRCVAETEKWLIWENERWEIDKTGKVMQLAKEVGVALYSLSAQRDPGSDRDRMLKHAAQTLNRPRLQAMIALAQTDPAIVLRSDQLDADDFLIGVENGVVDLRDGSFRDARREDLITRRCGTRYEAEATCPHFLQFLHQITDGNADLQDYLQRLVGYSLTGSTREQCFAFLYGRGANGKSTFLDVIMKLCGDYAAGAQPETMMARRNGGGATGDLARLAGKRLVVSNEVREDAHLEENLIKQLVGGDIVTARHLYKSEFEFRPKFKLLIAGNYQPVIKGDDDGIWRRVHLIPFVQTIPAHQRDKQLGEKLARELPGILNWAITGCGEWQKQGLNPPTEVTRATQRYRAEMDLFQDWIDQECVISPTQKVSSRELYVNYRSWCEDNGLKAMSSKTWSRKLGDRGFNRMHTRTGNVMEGLGLARLGPRLAAVA